MSALPSRPAMLAELRTHLQATQKSIKSMVVSAGELTVLRSTPLLCDAMLAGLARDGGLYVPERLTPLDRNGS